MRIAWKECVAELIGTFALCFIGAGAICTGPRGAREHEPHPAAARPTVPSLAGRRSN